MHQQFKNLFHRIAKNSNNPHFLVAATLLPPVFDKVSIERQETQRKKEQEAIRNQNLTHHPSAAAVKALKNKYQSYLPQGSFIKKEYIPEDKSKMEDGKMVEQQRKRLSVGAIDPSDVARAAETGRVPQDAKSLIQFYKGAAMIDIAENGHRAESSAKRSSTTSNASSRRGSFVISSVTSTRQEAFSEKNVCTEGDDDGVNHNMLLQLGIGIRCKKGLKPEAPNQDSFCFVNHEGEFRLYGVFDGHGQNGHDVSNFVREILPKAFLAHPERDTNTKKAMVEVFAQTQQFIVAERSIDAQTSGTTGTLAYWRIPENELWVAHCGDSRAMVLYEKGGKPNGADLTVDHKPNLPAEKRRIEEAGGCVIFDGFYNHRVFKKGTVFPGLNMSRAFGDLIGHSVGISEQPDVRCVKMDGKHQYTAFCLASDGVWEFIDAAEASRIISNASKGKKIDPGAAAEELAKTSWNNWMEDTCGEISDDITVVLQALDGNLPAGHPANK